jgi:hypothetical protein
LSSKWQLPALYRINTKLPSGPRLSTTTNRLSEFLPPEHCPPYVGVSNENQMLQLEHYAAAYRDVLAQIIAPISSRSLKTKCSVYL